ncbi:succinate dehydrogenase assembly factor 2 [Candidatus Hepatincola sp. Av]
MLKSLQLKQIEVRAKRRAMKELDLVMSFVVDTYLESMTEDQLQRFKQFLDLDDALLYKWLVNKEPIPEKYNNDIWQMLQSYQPNFEVL